MKIVFKLRIIVGVLALSLLFTACKMGGESSVFYDNNELGFSLEMKKNFEEDISIIEEENTIYFVDKNIRGVDSEGLLGVIGILYVFSKELYTYESIVEMQEMMAFKWIDENESYYYLWIHPTDIQIPSNTVEKDREKFHDLSREFEDVIKTIQLLKISPSVEIETENEPTDHTYSFQNQTGVFNLRDWTTIEEVLNTLGSTQLTEETILGHESDTFAGSWIRKLHYDGFSLTLFSPKDNGATFWIMELELTKPGFETYDGVTIGTSDVELKEVYPLIEEVFDGKESFNECDYILRSEDFSYNLFFRVEGHKVSYIKAYYEMK